MDVKEKLNEHLDALFATAPPSRAAYELREELFANSLERYTDMLEKGMPAEEAFQSVAASIGNVDELLAALPAEPGPVSPAWEEERRTRRAMTSTIAIALYMLAGIVLFAGLFLSSHLGLGSIVFFAVAAIICIVPTCLLVYTAHRWPKYEQREKTVVEDFKSWSNDTKRRKTLRAAISSFIWLLAVVVYFLLSFFTGAWALTWLIFLVAGCVEALVTLIFILKGQPS